MTSGMKVGLHIFDELKRETIPVIPCVAILKRFEAISECAALGNRALGNA